MDSYDSRSNANSIRERIKYGTPFQAFKAIFFDYLKESSIHGFKYVGEQKRSTLERIIWFCAVIVSISTCGYLIYNIWNKRNHNPVLVTLDGRLMPVWEIPFPTITICPQIKIHNKIFNLAKDEGTNLTEDEYEHCEILFTMGEGCKDAQNWVQSRPQYFWEVISQTGCDIPGLYYTTFFNEFIPNASKLIQIMSNVAPTLEETMHGCFWKNTMNYCKDMFDPVLTEEGICFSFNSIKSEHYRSEFYNSRQNAFFGNNFDNHDRKIEWDLEHGYNEEALYSLKAFPFHTVGAGVMESLFFHLLDEIVDEDNKCRAFLKGFKLTVQTPGEEPQVSKNFINIPFDQDVLLTIKPQIMTSSEGLRHYTPERRQCYYQNERYLRYFTKYTQANCELECLANQTLAKCGCVKFSMPRSSNHPVCGSTKLSCADQIADNFGSWKFLAKTKRYGESACIGNCLPTCFDIKYKAEIEQQVPSGEGKSFRLTLLTIKFNEDVFNGLLRSELYSVIDFIANCGGLLGLFMGVSILSLVELFYFLTLRLWLNLKKINQTQDVEQCWQKK